MDVRMVRIAPTSTHMASGRSHTAPKPIPGEKLFPWFSVGSAGPAPGTHRMWFFGVTQPIVGYALSNLRKQIQNTHNPITFELFGGKPNAGRPVADCAHTANEPSGGRCTIQPDKNGTPTLNLALSKAFCVHMKQRNQQTAILYTTTTIQSTCCNRL